MSEHHQTPEYRSRDFWLAASLAAVGMEIVHVEVRPRLQDERPGPPWTTFIFADRPDRPQLVRDYHADRLQVSALRLHAAFQRCQQLRSAAGGAGGKGA